eukprot:scaffold312431_cov22-Tisochrysis_lutea.AAC.1
MISIMDSSSQAQSLPRCWCHEQVHMPTRYKSACVCADVRACVYACMHAHMLTCVRAYVCPHVRACVSLCVRPCAIHTVSRPAPLTVPPMITDPGSLVTARDSPAAVHANKTCCGKE